MDLILPIGLGFGLAMDAFSIALSKGLEAKKIRFKDGMKIGSTFGIFQAIMPFLGWLIGKVFSEIIDKELIDNYDHWIAFVLLFFIGAKMIYETYKNCDEVLDCDLSFKCLFLFGVATSIDALVAGFALTGPENTLYIITIYCLIIGVLTFFISSMGFFFGSKLGKIIGSKSGLIGGAVLIIIGIKMLIEGLL